MVEDGQQMEVMYYWQVRPVSRLADKFVTGLAQTEA